MIRWSGAVDGKIKAKGCYRDAVRSSKKHVVRCFGLKWVAMMLLVPVPWATRVWALPFLTVLCWPPQSPHQRRHKTSVDWVRQMMKQVRRWLPQRLLVLVVDGGFAAVALALACQEQQVVMVARLRLDAALYHPPAPQPPGKRGRKPTKGHRQRSLKVWAARSDTPWEEVEVDWYRGQRKALRVFSRTALWYTPGWAPVAIRFVLVRDPEGKLQDAAFFCTDLQATPEQILHWVVMRWSVEVTFEEARAHLGMETQRQWSDTGHRPHHAGALGAVLPGDRAGAALAPQRANPGRDHGVVPESRAHLLGLYYLGTSASLAGAVFRELCSQAEYVQLPREAFEILLNDLPLAA